MATLEGSDSGRHARGLTRPRRGCHTLLLYVLHRPVFGMKGGATGGGKATVEPADDINLHFTGDFHAITAATNLLAALIDNHIYWNRVPRLDPRRIAFPRVLDVNHRALRNTIVGVGTAAREDAFAITAFSEVMAILGLARDYADLRERLGRIVVGATMDAARVDLAAAGTITGVR